MQRIPKTKLLYTYEPGRPAVATVRSGETILVETRTAFGDAELVQGVEVSGPEPDRADPLTGPIYVEGAEVGDALAVHIERIDLVGSPVIGPIRGCSALEWGPLPVDILEVRDGHLLVGSLSLPIKPMVGLHRGLARIGGHSEHVVSATTEATSTRSTSRRGRP